MERTSSEGTRRRRATTLALAAVALAAILGLAPESRAGQPSLVKDLDHSRWGCTPYGFVGEGSVLYFGTEAQCLGGLALWRSDGTVAGTRPVKTFEPGPSRIQRIGMVRAVAGLIYFVAWDDSQYGRIVELWRSDGTEAGTVRLRDFASGAQMGDLYAGRVSSVGSRLLFTANDGVRGNEPWVSDGTPEGTHPLLDVAPGNVVLIDAVPQGDGLVFSAKEGRSDSVWRTDGTSAGTRRLHGPRLDDGYVGARIQAGNDGLTYFTVAVAPGARELWRTNGRARGTRRVAALPFGATWSQVGSVHFALAALRQSAGVWRYDEGASAFVLVKSIPLRWPGERYLSEIGQQRGILYFRYWEELGGLNELWRSDGTEGGTFLLTEHDARFASPVDDGLLFSSYDGNGGLMPWITDGTAVGTMPLASVNVTTDGFVALGEMRLFRGGTWVESALWRTDGTAAGTEIVLPLRGFENPFSHAGLVFFVQGSAVWRSDGTAAGTLPLVALGPYSNGSSPNGLTSAAGTLFFTAGTNHLPLGIGLWRSDGSRPGTKHVAFFPSDGQHDVDLLTPAAGRLLFSIGAHELWGSDGGAAGTGRLADVQTGTATVEIRELVDVDGIAFAAVRGAEIADGALWRSDGTEGGTAPVKEGIAPRGLVAWSGALYFRSATDADHLALWRSDGSEAGTVPLATFARTASGALPRIGGIFPVAGGLFFGVASPEATELWHSDGTAPGTVLVKNLPLNQSVSVAREIVRGADLNGSFVFAFDDWISGNDLWQSDGTEAGTVKLADLGWWLTGEQPELGADTRAAGRLFLLRPREFDEDATGLARLWATDGTEAGTGDVGAPDVLTRSLLAAGDAVYFCAGSEAAGFRIWRSDGTPGGTRPAFAKPVGCGRELATAGNRLFFDGFTLRHGAELWSAVLDPP